MSTLPEEIVVEKLKDKNLILSTAESCTGGMLASRIVNVAGASKVFKGGFITYCNEAKTEMLGVSKQVLDQNTAVSAETAREMAAGTARKTNADICISITGVAGPDMEDGRPVGLVYIGGCYKGVTMAKECHFNGTRYSIREQAVEKALQLILELID